MSDATFERLAALILLVGGLVLLFGAVLLGQDVGSALLFWGSVSAGFGLAWRLS